MTAKGRWPRAEYVRADILDSGTTQNWIETPEEGTARKRKSTTSVSYQYLRRWRLANGRYGSRSVVLRGSLERNGFAMVVALF
jgi:hypothetical protein